MPQSLEDSAGDGTTSAVVFTGALLEKAENLIENGVHPTVIIKGFRLAADKAIEICESLALPVARIIRRCLKRLPELPLRARLPRNTIL